MALVMKFSLSSNFEALEIFILGFYSSRSILVFIGCNLSICLLPTRVVWELSQSSGEPILVFIGFKTGGKPNR